MSISAALYFKDALNDITRSVPIPDVELVVHINETLNEDKRQDLKSAVENLPGVRSARFTERRVHLMVVAYDRRLTSSFEILRGVTRQSVHAQLVGPV